MDSSSSLIIGNSAETSFVSMMANIQFKSLTEINATREENKKARQLILDNAKRQYEIKEAKKDKARLQGEGTWMLASVSHRINKEEKDLLKAKKKAKKKKKKKKKKKAQSDSSSSSSDSEEEQDEWVESSSQQKDAVTSGVMKGPQLQRESWMEAPLDIIPTTSRQEIRDAINKEKEEAKRKAEAAQQPGQHARELNPYWQDGGSGLPNQRAEKDFPATSLKNQHSGSMAPSGDGGYSWLKKAFDRCKQQAEDEGRSLEEVAAERWGSLKKLQKMLDEAKQKQTNISGGRSRDAGGSWKRDGDKRNNYERSDSERRRDRSRSRDRQSGRDRKELASERRERSNSRERQRRERSNSRERQRRERSNSRERQRRERSNSRERQSRGHHNRHSDKSDERRSNQTSRFRRPGLSDEERDEKERFSSSRFRRPKDDMDSHSSRSSRGFMRPLDADERSDRRETGSHRHTSSRDRRRSRTPDRDVPRWKKKTETEPRRESEEKSRGNADAKEQTSKLEAKDKRKKRVSSSSSSSSSDDNSEEDHKESEEEEEEVGGPQGSSQEPQPKILTEEELNDLAAKILRAEIMGEDEMAADLKAKLDAARQQRESLKSAGDLPGQRGTDFSHRRRGEGGGERGGRGRKGKSDESEDNVVVLSRTNKGGMVRPVLGEGSDYPGGRAGKKRKKAATTHDVSGMRTIYFDDDNKFDLKALVEQEKAGTAEDQNSMFSRLAGRAGDRDLDVDDMFVSKAARKQNEESVVARDKSAAIFEHRKINAAMEKCNRCFDKVPKHLIIAIGTKSYLCLPHHRSLTEGHCLIVPMQHVASCVSMDEDVWREMQVFRKTLVQMFLAEDEDVMFMETVMHLKHFPHTVIECVPLPKETGDLAPIYFKKAIQEAGPEWADNKKLHSLREKDVRHVIPKGFPYFSVDFGLQGGYATAIEDEQSFPSYFGREIVGGMIDAEPGMWRKPHKESFEDQRQKVLKFEAMWKPFDWTQDLSV